MPREGTTVFVSYSHADALLVAPVVKLLRANDSFVFQDIDRIQPGKKWRSEITKALNEAQLVVVFWCNHASHSKEVSNEWKAAIEQKKDLLPLLLDATPLPPELGEFQWIDFRGTVGGNHGAIEPPTPKLSAPVKSNWFSVAGLATIVVAAVGASLLTMNVWENASHTTINQPVDSLPSPPVLEVASSSSILLVVSVLLAVIIGVAWFLRRRSKLREVTKISSPHPGKIGQLIAIKLEAEIIRRTKSRQNVEA